MVTKINPIFDNDNARSFLGKSLTTVTVTKDGVEGSTGAEGAMHALIQTVAERATIAAHTTASSAGVITFLLEGEFPTDTYDGTNSEAFDVYLASTITALGTVDGVDFSSAVTVSSGTVYRADQV